MEDDLMKRSALGRVSASPAQGGHRQLWSHTIDYEDHLERQKKAEEAEKKERKAQAKLEKEKEKAKRKETDFWVFWGSISRSVQVPAYPSFRSTPLNYFAHAALDGRNGLTTRFWGRRGS